MRALIVAALILCAPLARAADVQDDGWFVAVDETPRGPLPASEVETLIKTAKAKSDTLGWRDGMKEWTPLSQIARFKSLFVTPPPLPPKVKPPPLPIRPPPLPPAPALQLTPPPLPAPSSSSSPSSPSSLPATPAGSRVIGGKTTHEPRWYYAENGEKRGPVPERALADLVRIGSIKHRTLVWTPGQDGWREADAVSTFTPLLREVKR